MHIDQEESLYNKYVNGEDWLRLTPRNPEYPVKTIRGSDLDQCHIYGEIVYIYSEIKSFSKNQKQFRSYS